MSSVLIIDDDPLMYELYQLIFENAGFEVAVAPNGPAGISLLAKGAKPDVILLDIMMPKMSGLEVLAKLAELPARPPVIALSNLLDESTERQAKEAGAIRYVVKSQIAGKELVTIAKECISVA